MIIMKLSDLKKRGDEYTGKASDITRQLIFAGIAIIWLFKSEDNGYTTLDSFLILPLITLSLSIIFDLLHYVTGGIIWKKLYLSEEHKVIKKLKNEPNTNLDPENIKFTRKKIKVFKEKCAFHVFKYYQIRCVTD